MQTCHIWPRVPFGAAGAAVKVEKPAKARRKLRWVGDSRKVLAEFPADVRYEIGTALRWAQEGVKHPFAKPLAGFGDAQVLEICDNYDTDTYRTVYTVRFKDAIYVLHAFQKKSKKGMATPKQEIELVRKRLTWAKEISAQSLEETVAS
jgi:phage-related protein